MDRQAAVLVTQVVPVLLVVQSIFSLWPILIRLALDEGNSAVLVAFTRDLVAAVLLWIAVAALNAWPIDTPPARSSSEEEGPQGKQAVATAFLDGSEHDVTKHSSSQSSEPRYDDDHARCTKHSGLLRYAMFCWWEEDSKLFLLLGLSSALNSLGYVVALEFISPFNASLLHPSIPVFAVILGAIYAVEHLTPRKLVGASTCVLGSILVVIFSESPGTMGKQDSLSSIGSILLVTHCLAMATLLVGQKFVPHRYSPLYTTAVYYSIGVALNIPLCLGLLTYNNGFRTLNLTSWLVVAFGAVFVVVFNYAALTWANKASSPTVPASSMMLQPPLTYVISVIRHHGAYQIVGYWELIGGIIIIAGLGLTMYPAASQPANNRIGTAEWAYIRARGASPIKRKNNVEMSITLSKPQSIGDYGSV